MGPERLRIAVGFALVLLDVCYRKEKFRKSQDTAEYSKDNVTDVCGTRQQGGIKNNRNLG